jgi:hypothetical protein
MFDVEVSVPDGGDNTKKEACGTMLSIDDRDVTDTIVFMRWYLISKIVVCS